MHHDLLFKGANTLCTRPYAMRLICTHTNLYSTDRFEQRPQYPVPQYTVPAISDK